MPEQAAPPENPLPSSGPPWQAILEDIRSQNRATIEAVEAVHSSLGRKIEEHQTETRAQFQVLQAAVRQNSADIRVLQEDVRQNSADIRVLQEDVRQNSADIRVLQEDVRNLSDKVDATHSDVDARVSVLEQRRG